MAGEKRYTRIPPESTGDRVYMIHTAEIEFQDFNQVAGGTTDHVWQIGAQYTIEGFTGGTAHVHGAYLTNNTGPTGILAVHYNKVAKYENSEPTVGAEIRDSDGNAVATITDFYDVYIPANNIAGGDNPEYLWDIDRFGSGSVRFSEGPAELSGFNSLRVSRQKLVAEYLFLKNALPGQFSNALIGSGSITYQPTYQAVQLQIGDTTNDQATHTSNLYHPVLPGSSTIFLMAARVGDTGQAGAVRNWGAFDATDGFFFSLNGTTLNVVHRKTLEGSTTNVSIPQSNWNKDKLDGTGSSGMTLDVSKSNLYWYDYQHIGGGRIRWGVYYQGERLVCHEMYMENTTLHNAISNPNRPICWATKCLDGTQYTGTLDFYAYGAGVFLESDTNVIEEGELKLYDHSHTVAAADVETKYVFSARPVENIDGIENHSLYLPKFLQFSAYDSVAPATDRRMEVRGYAQCILRGESYSQEIYTTVEIDDQADHLAHGQQIFEAVIKGDGEVDLSRYFSTLQNGTLKVNAETTTSVRRQPITSITNANPAVLSVGANPVTGQNRHFFNDRNEVDIKDVTATGPNALNNTAVYLALTGGSTAVLYANLADLDDNRIVRELTLDSTTNVVVGDTIVVNGAGTAVITALDGSVVSVEGRTDALLDVGLAVSAFTTTSGGVGNVTSVALQSAAYPKDYETVLNAVDGSGWASPASDGDVEGLPPSRTAWTFMVKHLAVENSDTATKWALNWKERIQ